ncbi:unnamed protein product, partial [Closterium sp. Naga37s-1]
MITWPPLHEIVAYAFAQHIPSPTVISLPSLLPAAAPRCVLRADPVTCGLACLHPPSRRLSTPRLVPRAARSRSPSSSPYNGQSRRAGRQSAHIPAPLPTPPLPLPPSSPLAPTAVQRPTAAPPRGAMAAARPSCRLRTAVPSAALLPIACPPCFVTAVAAALLRSPLLFGTARPAHQSTGNSLTTHLLRPCLPSFPPLPLSAPYTIIHAHHAPLPASLQHFSWDLLPSAADPLAAATAATTSPFASISTAFAPRSAHHRNSEDAAGAARGLCFACIQPPRPAPPRCVTLRSVNILRGLDLTPLPCRHHQQHGSSMTCKRPAAPLGHLAMPMAIGGGSPVPYSPRPFGVASAALASPVLSTPVAPVAAMGGGATGKKVEYYSVRHWEATGPFSHIFPSLSYPARAVAGGARRRARGWNTARCAACWLTAAACSAP